MDESRKKFLNEILKERKTEIVLKDYASDDGYKVLNCPFRTCSMGICPDGSNSIIPASVMYRIDNILHEMRKKGITEMNYYV